MMMAVLSLSIASLGIASVLWAEGLSRSNDGSTFQFRDVSLNLPGGARLGLVGPNGCGKSTLLRTLAGVDRSDAGQVGRSKGARVVYVDQEPPTASTGRTVRDVVYGGGLQAEGPVDEALAALLEYHHASDAGDAARLERAALAVTSCWDVDTAVAAIAERLGVSTIMDCDIRDCSGGEAKRAALASALARDADVLLLDEPTNHLDAQGIEWLVDVLTRPTSNRRQPAVICVSHDRSFLERTCADGLLDLDAGCLVSFDWQGEYARYLELKAERLAAAEGAASRARTLLVREREWMAQQPRARQAKSRARQERYESLEDAAASAPAASRTADVGAVAGGGRRLGQVVLRLQGATIERAASAGPIGVEAAAKVPATRVVVDDLSLELRPGSRWGVVGSNGCGKSTLLSAIAGNLPLSSGERKVGETVRFGVFDQRGLDLDADGGRRVLEYATMAVEEARKAGAAAAGAQLADVAARRLLQLVAFPPDRWAAIVQRLSGGERRRLQLLRVLAAQPNVLLLDEPTNDLDLATIAALERWLCDEYEGVLLCVSHDRTFIDRTCVDGVLAFTAPGRVEALDSYAAYVDRLQQAAAAAAAAEVRESRERPKQRNAGKPRVGLSWKEARELEAMEDLIGEMQKDLAHAEAAVEAACADGSASSFDEMARLSQRAADISDALAAKEERWLHLLELEAAGIAAKPD